MEVDSHVDFAHQVSGMHFLSQESRRHRTQTQSEGDSKALSSQVHKIERAAKICDDTSEQKKYHERFIFEYIPHLNMINHESTITWQALQVVQNDDLLCDKLPTREWFKTRRWPPDSPNRHHCNISFKKFWTTTNDLHDEDQFNRV